LVVNGSLLSAVTVSGGTLGGTGTIKNSVTVQSGGTLTPGTPPGEDGLPTAGSLIGILVVTNNVFLQGTTLMELDKSANTNDSIRGARSILYGGTLSVTNLSGTLATGDSFKLFYATSYLGSFARIAPPMPGSGLAWDTSLLNSSGTLRIVSAPRPRLGNIYVTGTTLRFSASNGIPNATCYVIASTNLAAPLANWTVIASPAFDANGSLNFSPPLTEENREQYLMLQWP
jgi:hypothetical protein